MGAERWGREACRDRGEGRVGRDGAPRDAGGRGPGGAPRGLGRWNRRVSFKRGRPPGGAGCPEAPPLAWRMSACGREGGSGPPPGACAGGRSSRCWPCWVMVQDEALAGTHGLPEAGASGENRGAAGALEVSSLPLCPRGELPAPAAKPRETRRVGGPGSPASMPSVAGAERGPRWSAPPPPPSPRPLPGPAAGVCARPRWNQRVHALSADLSVSWRLYFR